MQFVQTLNTVISGMVSRFERGLQKFVALFVQPYAKYLANKDQGDIIQIIARKK